MIHAPYRERGMTWMETAAAIALVGLAVMVGASLLAAHPRASDRLAAQHELVRVLDATLESVRGGVVPLASGELAPPVPTEHRIRLALEVRPVGPSGLWEVTAVARCEVRREPVERRLSTLMWRPS